VVGIAPLAVSALLAAILWVAAFGLAAGLPLGYLLFAAVAWIGGNYCLEIVEHRATGADGWPVLSIETMVAARHQLGLAFAVCAGLGVLLYAYLIAEGRQGLATTWAAIAVGAGPAVIVLLGVARSLTRSLDPRNILRAAAGLGLNYIPAVAAAAGLVWLASFAYEHRRFPELFATVYAALVLAYLIGSAAYRRRLVLGVHAPRAPEVLAEAEYRALVSRRRHALEHAYGIAAGGGLRKALEHLTEYVGTERDSLDARLWLFQEMTRWRDVRPAIELGKSLAGDLNAAERREEAAKVLVGCRYLEERSPPREGR
jgi:hypothetical protein